MHRSRSNNSPPQSTDHIDTFQSVLCRLLMAREHVVYLCTKLDQRTLEMLIEIIDTIDAIVIQ
jgi:hypothetical protein